ncbi:MAG: DUF4270 domain-containing protein [Prevotella sp.]|nr:DUF4270 domain-containing protein [Candidatus Equicola stercoris]
MKKFLFVIITTLLLTACDENTLELGTSIVPTIDEVDVAADTFNITSKTLKVDSILARTGTGYLGCFRDPESKAYITQNFLSQIHMLEDIRLDSIENMYKEDGKVIADSCFVRLYIDSFYGDSLNQMKMTCYEMGKPLEENIKFYSNFDIEKSSSEYIRKDGIKVDRVWTIDDLTLSDSIRSQAFGRFILTSLNNEYKDKNGNVYNNYGTYLLRMYYEHPEYYKNSYEFIHNVCPGFYFKTTNGIGTIAKIKLSDINIYYRYHRADTLQNRAIIFYGTNEVKQFTNVQNDEKRLNEMVNDNSCTYLKTPAGLITEITFPVEKIFDGHENDSINVAEFTLSRYNNTVDSKYSLTAPSTIMLIQKDSLKNFFEGSKIIDGETSFLAATSASKNTYTFNDVSSLLTIMRQAKQNGTASSEWNKAVLVPVVVTYNTSEVITNVRHEMDMHSVKLVGGDENSHDPIRMKVIFSKIGNTN